MDHHLDTCWCPVCDRQILPKRYLVPVAPPQPPPPPSSPTKPTDTPRRTKGGTIRQRGGGGLVHGTGRVKPNGALKRSDSSKSTPAAAAPTKPPAPLKHRTIIDQGPIPLYCSDECQMADLASLHHSGLPLSYDPARYTHDSSSAASVHTSPVLPPVPHNSFSDSSSSDDSLLDSAPSSSSAESGSGPSSSTGTGYYSSPSIATLAALYDFPPLPPPPPLLQRTDSTSTSSSTSTSGPCAFQSGVMMAAKRIVNTLSPPAPPKRPSMLSSPSSSAQDERRGREVIPGWTDGSAAWRASVYSFSTPPQDSAAESDAAPKAYQSFAASPHRSRGVYSTLGEQTAPNTPTAPAMQRSESSLSGCASDSLYAPAPALSFSRSSAQSLPPTRRTRTRTRPLVKPGAEGKLCVPDVKMSVSVDSLSSSARSSGSGSSYAASSRRSVRSPLSRWGSEVSDGVFGMLGSVAESEEGGAGKRPVVETRSWSYDNVATYPVMPLPPRKEKRRERRVVDGEERVVEVEVEVVQERKRLFLFPGKEMR